MKKKVDFLKLGKLKHEFLGRLLKEFDTDSSIKDNRIVLGPKIGEDAAIIDMGNHYLVAKTDPITFTTDEIGYYCVNVNVNDLVCTGAIPKWFQAVILLPEKNTTEEKVEEIFKKIHDACKKFNISIIGGHTEVTAGLDRPIIIGSLLGEVDKEKLVITSNVKENDDLILTKGIFIEGTAIIGREKENFLKSMGLNIDFIEKCKDYLFNPGISVYKEALVANENFKINSMHDPTEGGLACGIVEMALASNLGVIIEEERIMILEEPLKLSEIFGLNPLGTITSGSLLISIDNRDSADLVNKLRKNGIQAEIIGHFIEKNEKYLIKNKEGKIQRLQYSEKDEIVKIFKF